MTVPKRTTTWDGIYESRQIPTADLQPGHVISAPGIGLWTTLSRVRHLPGDVTEVTYAYSVAGRGRRGTSRRKTSGKTTVHVRIGDPEGGVPGE